MSLVDKGVDELEKSVKVFPSEYAQSYLPSVGKSESFVNMAWLEQGHEKRVLAVLPNDTAAERRCLRNSHGPIH